MKAPPAARHTRFLVPTIIAVQFIQPFMVSGVTVALPPIGADLGAGATSLGLLETLFLAGSVAALLPAGRLADASDKATLYKLGLTAFGLTSVLVGLLSSVPWMLLVRFLQGVAAALVAVIGPALLAELVPPERRGRVYGAMIASVYAGLTLGPMVAGLLIDTWGWRAVFFVGGAALLAARVAARRVLPSNWRAPAPGAVHLPSTVLLAGSMLLLVLGTAFLRAGAIGYALFAAGLALGALFVRVQRRVAQPLVDVDVLMRNIELRNALLVQVLIYTNAIGAAFLLSIYMQVTLGHSARLAGQIIGLGSILMAVVSPFAGILADRYRPAPIALGGVALLAIGAFMLTTLDAGSSLFLIAAALAVQGVGFALFSSPNMAIVMNSVSRERASMASALVAKGRSFGMLMGVTIAVALISLYLGNEPVDREPLRFLEPMIAAFWVLAILTVAALAFGLAGIRGARRDP